MRILILGNIEGNIDEGMKKIAFNLANEFSKKHEVFVVNPLNMTNITFWSSIKKFNPQIVHYIPGPSLNSFILVKIISYMFIGSQIAYIMSTPLPKISQLSRLVIPSIKVAIMITESSRQKKNLKLLV